MLVMMASLREARCIEFTGDARTITRCSARSAALASAATSIAWRFGQRPSHQRRAVEVALSNTSSWENAASLTLSGPARAGSGSSFSSEPGSTCRRHESASILVQEPRYVLLDEVELTESAEVSMVPQISPKCKELLPNSSFRVRHGSWGSYTWDWGWAGNLYGLEGDWTVPSPAWPHALRISLNPATLPVFWFDYYEPVRQPSAACWWPIAVGSA